MADIAGISINTLYKIERGQANPTIEVPGKILDVLGMEGIAAEHIDANTPKKEREIILHLKISITFVPQYKKIKYVSHKYEP